MREAGFDVGSRIKSEDFQQVFIELSAQLFRKQ